MKKFLTGAYTFSLVSNIVTSSSGFIAIWALARILSAEELGKWLLYITAFTFCDMMRSGIIHTALIKHSSRSDKQSVVGSSWLIGIGLSVLIVIIICLLEYINFTLTGNYYEAELSFYLKLLILTSFPVAISLWLQQMDEFFNRLMYIRLILSIPFLIFIVSGFFFSFHLEILVQIHLMSYIATSVLTIALGWSSIQSILEAKVAIMQKLLSFGKYTMGTLVSTNLLKSADTFMISWYLGPAVLAAYNLPYKLIELVEIPLRSLSATFLPQAVKQSNKHNLLSIKIMFYQYTSLLSLFILPAILLMFFFAEEIVIMLGGKTYAGSASILRCFLIYSLFLPLDRFLGITLDILNKPHLNLLKVCLMVLINISGNLLAIHFFSSPELIAVATIITVICGSIIGWVLLSKTIPIKPNELAATGYFLLKRRIYYYIKYKPV